MHHARELLPDETHMKWAKLGLLVFLGILALYVIRTAFRPVEEPVTVANVGLLKLHAAFAREVAAHRKAEVALHLRGVSLRQIADTSTNLPQKVLFLQQSCRAFETEALTCQQRAERLRERVDTLETALRAQIRVTGCKVVFVPCLTRTQSFAVGILLGVGGSILLRHP